MLERQTKSTPTDKAKGPENKTTFERFLFGKTANGPHKNLESLSIHFIFAGTVFDELSAS